MCARQGRSQRKNKFSVGSVNSSGTARQGRCVANDLECNAKNIPGFTMYS